MKPRVLVAAASRHGHSARIAARVAGELRDHEMLVELARLDRGDDPPPIAFDAVVVVASVHSGHHQHEVVRWVRRHAITLNRRPTAFLSVSLTAADADADEHARAEVQRRIDELLDDTGWSPLEALAVAGALQYEHYDLPTRVLMRLIARHHGAPDDVSHDVDFTDWPALDAFAARFADRISSTRPAPEVPA